MASAAKFSMSTVLGEKERQLDDGLFGLEDLEGREVQGPDMRRTAKRKAALQSKFQELARQCFGKFAGQA